jgi:hypothetical protein
MWLSTLLFGLSCFYLILRFSSHTSNASCSNAFSFNVSFGSPQPESTAELRINLLKKSRVNTFSGAHFC